MTEQPCSVGLALWDQNDGIADGFFHQLKRAGYQPARFLLNQPVPPGLDVVVAGGPFGSLLPLARNLLALPPETRPALALVLTEQLPNPRLPEWWRHGLGRLRSLADRRAYALSPQGEWRIRPGWGWLLRGATRYRYYGDLFWLRESGLLSGLAVWSHVTAGFLRQRGFEPLVLRIGRNPHFGKDLGLERDIPVLWIGKTATRRRARLLRQVRAQLAARGVALHVVDGVENPYVFGEDRTLLLNRTRIILNVLRSPWDDNSLRHVLAAHNRALLVSEPSLPHTDFQPGRHMVEAPPARLAETISYYLEHEDERRRIATNASRMLNENTALGAGLVPLITLALERRRAQAPVGAMGPIAPE